MAMEILETDAQKEAEIRAELLEAVMLLVEDQSKLQLEDIGKNKPWGLWEMYLSTTAGEVSRQLLRLTINEADEVEDLVQALVALVSLGINWLQEVIHYDNLTEKKGQ